jgi:hypothetical protein
VHDDGHSCLRNACSDSKRLTRTRSWGTADIRKTLCSVLSELLDVMLLTQFLS